MSAAASQNAHYALRPELAECHEATWQHIASAGTWWTGEERVAIAEEVRRARACRLCAERKAAVSPFSVDGDHDSAGKLPSTVVDVIHRITTDPGRLTQSWLRGVLEAGLADTHYVELVGCAVISNALDVFQRALSFEDAQLPAPLPGEPTRERPDAACEDGAWVPLIPNDATAALEVYRGMSTVPNIGRALSLVPKEVAALAGLSGPHYMELGNVRDPNYETPGRAIDRLQMELVAARVSLLNECFY